MTKKKKKEKILACTCLIALDKLRKQKTQSSLACHIKLESDILKKKKIHYKNGSIVWNKRSLSELFFSFHPFPMSLPSQSQPTDSFCQVPISPSLEALQPQSQIGKSLVTLSSPKGIFFPVINSHKWITHKKKKNELGWISQLTSF